MRHQSPSPEDLTTKAPPLLGGHARLVHAMACGSARGQELRVAARVELADEVAETVLELEAAAVGAPVVDDEDAEVFERALEHAAAPIPGGAGCRKLEERVGAVRDASAIHLAEHVVERARG